MDLGSFDLTILSSVLFSRGTIAELTQTVDTLDVTRPYTISFWLSLTNVATWVNISSCTLSVLLNDSPVFTKDYTRSDVISGQTNWKLITTR